MASIEQFCISLIGMWYTLQGEIEEAKELPKIDIEKIFTDEYPSKPDGHNWPGLMNNTKTKSEVCRKIWMLYMIY